MTKQKKHSRTSPDLKFEKFSKTKQKLDLERTKSELGKPFPWNNQIIKFENLKSMLKRRMWTKSTSEKANLFLFKHRFLTLR